MPSHALLRHANPALQVEAYFQGKGILGVPPAPTYWYWIGASRQFNASLLTSQAAAGKRFYTVTGTQLPFYAPSNGASEAPMYAPYAHWSVYQFSTNRMYSYANQFPNTGDCVMSDLYYSWVAPGWRACGRPWQSLLRCLVARMLLCRAICKRMALAWRRCAEPATCAAPPADTPQAVHVLQQQLRLHHAARLRRRLQLLHGPE
jgi:hypothetical protein